MVEWQASQDPVFTEKLNSPSLAEYFTSPCAKMGVIGPNNSVDRGFLTLPSYLVSPLVFLVALPIINIIQLSNI